MVRLDQFGARFTRCAVQDLSRFTGTHSSDERFSVVPSSLPSRAALTEVFLWEQNLPSRIVRLFTMLQTSKEAFADSHRRLKVPIDRSVSVSRDRKGSLTTLSRWIKMGVLLAVLVIGGATVFMVSHWPFTRETIVNALQEKFSSTVELKAFHGTYFPPGCVAEGMTFRRNGDGNAPPIATIERLTIQGAYWESFSIPKRVRRVRVEGLRMFVSPGTESPGNAVRPTSRPQQSALIIDEIIADGAVVEFASGKPGTEPLKFDIHKLTLNSVADDRPMSYHAALLNAKPPGEIHADGQFGPLRPQNVRQTPLSGSYVFQRADLGVFSGIEGTLSSAGKFNGVLEQIQVEGSTDAPDFKVARSNHAVHLKTQFSGMVNGIDGDVSLSSVQAQFGRTALVSQIEVAEKTASEGKTVSVGATEQEGRIQDWLFLLAKSQRPALTGAMNFRAQVAVPPGKRTFIERVNLRADFGIDAASFVSAATQQAVDNLSQVAEGEKENDDPANVVEHLKGHVVLNHAIATFSDLSFSVPGALAHLHGTYGLLTQNINLRGSLQLDNKLSKGAKGMKSVLLKSVEPFLKKAKAGEIIPIKVGGTFSHPSYGLDLGP
jgi:hypothetical protein